MKIYSIILMYFFVLFQNIEARPADDYYSSFKIDDATLDLIIDNINKEKRKERRANAREWREAQEQLETSEVSSDESDPIYTVVPKRRPAYFDYREEQEYLDLLMNKSIDETKNHSCVRQFIAENPDVDLTNTDVFKHFSLCSMSEAYKPPVAPNRDDPASLRLIYDPSSFCACVNEKLARNSGSNLGPYKPLPSKALEERGEEIQNLIMGMNIDELAADYQEFAHEYAYIKTAPEFYSLYQRSVGDNIQANSLVKCDPDELAALPIVLARENVCSLDIANKIVDSLSINGDGIDDIPQTADTTAPQRIRERHRDFSRDLRSLNGTNGRRRTPSSISVDTAELLDRSERLSPKRTCLDFEAITNSEACSISETSPDTVVRGVSGEETTSSNTLSVAAQTELFEARTKMISLLVGTLDHMYKNDGSLAGLPKSSTEFMENVRTLVLTNPFLKKEFFPNTPDEEISLVKVQEAMGKHLTENIYPALKKNIEEIFDNNKPTDIDLTLTLGALAAVIYPDYLNSLGSCQKMIRKITNLCGAFDKGNPAGGKPLITPFLLNSDLMRPLLEASQGADPDGLIQSLITDSSQVACSEHGRAIMHNSNLAPDYTSTSDVVADSLTAEIRAEVKELTRRRPEEHAASTETRDMNRDVASGDIPETTLRSDSFISYETRLEMDSHRTKEMATIRSENAVERARRTAEFSDNNPQTNPVPISNSSPVTESEVIYNSADASHARPEEALFSAAQVKASQSISSRLREEMTEEEIANLSPHEKRLLDELDRLAAREAKLEEDLRRSEKEKIEIRDKARLEEQDRMIASLKNELKDLKAEIADLSKSLSQPAKVAVEKITAPSSTAAKITNEPVRSNSTVISSDKNTGNSGTAGGQVAHTPTQASGAVGGGVRSSTTTPLAPNRSGAGLGSAGGGLSPLILTNRLNSSDASISQLAESQNAVVYRQTNMAGFVEKIVFKTVDGRVLFENGEPVIEETQLIAMEETEIQAWLAQMSQSGDGRFPASVLETPELIELERRSTPSARHNNLIEEIQKQRELIETEN